MRKRSYTLLCQYKFPWVYLCSLGHDLTHKQNLPFWKSVFLLTVSFHIIPKACDQFVEANHSLKHIDSNCQFDCAITTTGDAYSVWVLEMPTWVCLWATMFQHILTLTTSQASPCSLSNRVLPPPGEFILSNISAAYYTEAPAALCSFFGMIGICEHGLYRIVLGAHERWWVSCYDEQSPPLP